MAKAAPAERPETGDIEAALDALADMPRDRLVIEWRRYHRRPPPTGLSRDLLVRAIGFKIQERALGGLPQSTKRTLRTLARKMETEGSAAIKTARPLRPGTRLVRTWNGRTYRVTVCAEGFEFDGRLYRSLSRIAREITGVHRSGPRFFGLTSAGPARRPDGSARDA